MLCFTFLGDPAAKIHLCEEMLVFSAYRVHGVRIGATLIVTPGNATNRYLDIVHRRTLSSFRLATHADWNDPNSSSYPFTCLFSNITKGRFRHLGKNNYAFTYPDEGPSASQPVTLLVPEPGKPYTFTDLLPVESKHREHVPFSCYRIGPFPQGNGTYVVRFECQIHGSSFQDLIPEDVTTATRTYRIYGPDHINRHIATVDLPQAQSLRYGDGYRRHAEFFQSINEEQRLLPERYAVIAVDNPNGNNIRLSSLKLTDELKDRSLEIDDGVYSHQSLSRVRDRILWFVCQAPTNSFYLQLHGPIALSELVPAGAAR